MPGYKIEATAVNNPWPHLLLCAISLLGWSNEVQVRVCNMNGRNEKYITYLSINVKEMDHLENLLYMEEWY
jgi:hypothetical protein